MKFNIFPFSSEHMTKDKSESEKVMQLQSNEIDSHSLKSSHKQDFNM